MDYKKEMSKLLNDLKQKNHSRRKIEEYLGYAPKTLDQILSKGGNESIVIKLRAYKSDVDKGIIKNFTLEDEEVKYLKKTKHINPERALIDMLILEVAKMKSKLYGMTVDDAILELEQNASLVLRQIEKSSGS
jgi:hypothetical protein